MKKKKKKKKKKKQQQQQQFRPFLLDHIFSIKIKKLKINDQLSVENEDTRMSYGNLLKNKEDTGSFCINGRCTNKDSLHSSG